MGFFVLAYYEKFWVSLGTAEIDVNENNVFFDGFDPYGLEIICFIFSVFVKNNNNQKMINLSIPVENLWIWKSRALNALPCQFYHIRK